MKIGVVQMLVALASVAAFSNFEPAINNEISLSAALSFIVDFYVKQSNTIFIYQYSISRREDMQHGMVLGNILADNDPKISVTWTINDHHHLNQSIERINNIIIIDSYKSWSLISNGIIKSSESFVYYTIVLSKYYEDQTTIVNSILHDCWQADCLNSNVLTYESPGNVDNLIWYTYFPFTPSHCGIVVPLVWNHFRNGHFVNSNRQLFPRKTEDFHQCPISILVCPLQPFIFVTKKYSNDTYDFAGSEYNLLLALSERINFRPKYFIHADPNIGMVLDNGTVTQALGMVSRREVNMTVGAFILTPETKTALSATASYSFENMIFVVPNARPYSAFEKLFSPFTLSSWMLILATCLIAVLVIKILERNNRILYEFVVGDSNSSPYLNLIHVLITAGGLNEPRQSFARFLLMLWIMACLILQTVYQGQLFNFLTTNKMKQSVKTIDELVERNITIKLIEENFHLFLHFDKRMDKLLKFVDSQSNWEYVTETEAYVSLEMQLVDETRRKTIEKLIFDKPQTVKIATFSHVLYLPKHTYMKQSLDAEITSMNENGLTGKWDAPYKETAIYYINDERNAPRQLNISQIIGIIELCFGLLMLATVTFIFEMLSMIYPFTVFRN